jgi:hypothetical protein
MLKSMTILALVAMFGSAALAQGPTRVSLTPKGVTCFKCNCITCGGNRGGGSFGFVGFGGSLPVGAPPSFDGSGPGRRHFVE